MQTITLWLQLKNAVVAQYWKPVNSCRATQAVDLCHGALLFKMTAHFCSTSKLLILVTSQQAWPDIYTTIQKVFLRIPVLISAVVSSTVELSFCKLLFTFRINVYLLVNCTTIWTSILMFFLPLPNTSTAVNLLATFAGNFIPDDGQTYVAFKVWIERQVYGLIWIDPHRLRPSQIKRSFMIFYRFKMVVYWLCVYLELVLCHHVLYVYDKSFLSN